MRCTTLYAVVITTALLFQAQEAISCSLVRGYFYQVTKLRGRIVGMTNYWPLLGYRSYPSYPSWIRHRLSRDNVKLRLDNYGWPTRNRSETPPIKTVTTDKNGGFDFGSIPVGHYTLVIDWPVIDGDFFDVEVNNRAVETSSVTIDVSPVDPDCKGGHEFMIRSK
jgi:hypothetical protein